MTDEERKRRWLKRKYWQRFGRIFGIVGGGIAGIILVIVIVRAINSPKPIPPQPSPISEIEDIEVEEMTAKKSSIVMVCNAVTDIDGNQYDAVKIDGRVWMAENMRATKDCDGNSLALCDQVSTETPYRYYPCGEENKVGKFGYLYNWEAAMRVCPKGWHLPKEEEWEKLNDEVWLSQKFGVLLAGGRYLDNYKGFGEYADFWTATEYDDISSKYRYLIDIDGSSEIRSGEETRDWAFSVRCVKD